MIPRDYQQEAVNAARSRTAAHGNTILMLPTGAGKTAVAGFYIGEEAQAPAVSQIPQVQPAGSPPVQRVSNKRRSRHRQRERERRAALQAQQPTAVISPLSAQE